MSLAGRRVLALPREGRFLPKNAGFGLDKAGLS